MSPLRYFRKNVYKWHRITSLLVAVPILLWTVSGFLHPIMNAKKPMVSNQSLSPITIDPAAIRVSLQEALIRNGITSIRNFSIIQLKDSYYYQVERVGSEDKLYLDCTTGAVLPRGDMLYAGWLARRMLDEKPQQPQHHDHADHTGKNEMKFAVSATPVATGVRTPIASIEFISEFDSEYKPGQRILSVYKVTFDRKDNIRLYIDTRTGKLITAIDDRKAGFDRFFGIAHSWSFLNGLGKIKSILLGSFSFLCFITSLLGFYVYAISKKKTGSTKKKSWGRRLHRIFGNMFLLTTMLYGVSGAWHAFKKVSAPAQGIQLTAGTQFETSALHVDLKGLLSHIDKNEKWAGLSIVYIEGIACWQLYCSINDKKLNKKYITTGKLETIPDGDMKYACWLACKASGNTADEVTSTHCVSAFNHSYSMMNKRLPVVGVHFEKDDEYFIETATGMLAACTGPADAAERFSFSNFHMHHYPEMWFGKENGKPVRNGILITSTLGLLLLAATGITILVIKRSAKNKRSLS